MNIFIPVMLSLSLLTSIPAKITYDNQNKEELIKTIWSEEELVNYVSEQARINGVDVDKAVRVMKCEAPWKPNKEAKHRYYDKNDAQSRLTYNTGQIKRNPDWGKVGEREKSYGIWQYHLPAHKMTIEQASDVVWSTERAMQDLKTKPNQWTCK